MSLLSLPNELLRQIAICVAYVDCGHASLNNFARTNRRLFGLLNGDLHGTINSDYLLHWGIENDKVNTISLALAYGADPNISFKPSTPSDGEFGADDDYNAVELAASRRCESKRQWRRDGCPPAGLALPRKHLDTLIFLLNSGGKPTPKSLANAIYMEDLDIIRLFAAYGMDLDQRHGRWTVLGFAGCLGRINAMRLLLELGADVNCGRDAVDKDENRPPLWAVAVESGAGAAPLVVLLEAGADVQYTEDDGTGFVEALNMRKELRQEDTIEEKIEVLVRYGAKVPDKKEKDTYSMEADFSKWW